MAVSRDDERQIMVVVMRERIDKMLKEMAPAIQEVAIRDCLSFVSIDRVRGEAVERVLRRWSTSIDSAARKVVGRLGKL